MRVNVLLSSRAWLLPRNQYGVRQHVKALYEEAFRGCDVRFFPISSDGHILGAGLRHVPALLQGSINVLTPGYPVVSGAVALALRRELGLVVHTWKVPGHTDPRAGARLYDFLLARVVRNARAVVVVSQLQVRQFEAMGLSCPVFFSPVTADTGYWCPVDDTSEVLSCFGLNENGYVLTVGGNDRDELYGARLARLLQLPYVRATNDPSTAQRVRKELERAYLWDGSRILASPSDEELRVLYKGAFVVCLPTITRTNPAGLTALVEAMSCGGVVAIPAEIGEGYVEDGVSGFLLDQEPGVLAGRLRVAGARMQQLRVAARETAQGTLNVVTVATQLRNAILGQANCN